eukprot:1152886-Pyramimonas_sp.AAC.1
MANDSLPDDAPSGKINGGRHLFFTFHHIKPSDPSRHLRRQRFATPAALLSRCVQSPARARKRQPC